MILYHSPVEEWVILGISNDILFSESMKHKNLLLSLAGLASIACLVYGATPGRLPGSTVRQPAGNEFSPKSTEPVTAHDNGTKKSRRAEQSDLPLLYGIAQAEGSDFALYSFQPTGDFHTPRQLQTSRRSSSLLVSTTTLTKLPATTSPTLQQYA